jgi:[acyl-carrier-protein] S-malonyltransferase
MTLAYVFPGQGSQAVGMAREAAEAHPGAMALLDRANEVLGRDLKAIMFGGPEEALKDTINTQPALYAASLALLEAARPWLPQPALVAGHSLGEYSALAAAGVFSFEDGLRLVDCRARAMAEQGRINPGTMAAILGLEDAAVAGACAEASALAQVEVANYNCPGQVVISGRAEGVARAMELCQAKGAAKCVPLAVSGPFHSSFMIPAGDALRAGFGQAAWHAARVPVVANVLASPIREVEAIQGALVRQVSQPVQWTASVRAMLAAGVDSFIEIGSGRVLSGLIKKAERGAIINNIEDLRSLEKARAALAPGA